MFDFFSSGDQNSKSLPERWIISSSDSEIEEIFGSGTHVVYKHSYSCGICIFSKKALDEILPKISDDVQCIFIDVRKNRSLSLLVEKKSGVKHESPQVLLICNGEVAWHASHSSIKAEALLEKLSAVRKNIN